MRKEKTKIESITKTSLQANTSSFIEKILNEYKTIKYNISVRHKVHT